MAAVAGVVLWDQIPHLLDAGSAEESSSYLHLLSDLEPVGAIDLLGSPASSPEKSHTDSRILVEGPFLQIVRCEEL